MDLLGLEQLEAELCSISESRSDSSDSKLARRRLALVSVDLLDRRRSSFFLFLKEDEALFEFFLRVVPRRLLHSAI